MEYAASLSTTYNESKSSLLSLNASSMSFLLSASLTIVSPIKVYQVLGNFPQTASIRDVVHKYILLLSTRIKGEYVYLSQTYILLIIFILHIQTV